MKRILSRPARHALFAACLGASLVLGGAGAAFADNWSWGGEAVQGSGRVVKQNRQVSAFKGVSLGLPGQVMLRAGSSESVTIEADDNLLPLIETVVEDGMLKIRPTKRNLNLQSKAIRIVVQARTIERLALGGSGSIEAEPLRTRTLEVDLGGSGTIKLQGVESESLAVAIGGSGDLQAARGTTGKLSVSIAGSGDVDLGRVQADNASVSITGSGEAKVWARKALAATIVGSGDVSYYGDPQLSKSQLGSGSVQRLGAAPR
jgi:hypothetical protein